MPSLVERFGRERALALCRASAESVTAIGAWCDAQGVDAWFTRSGFLMASTAPAHDAVLDVDPRRRSRASSRSRSTAQRCARAATRRASAAGCSCPTTRPSSPRGSRSGCANGCSTPIYERSRVVALRHAPGEVVAETAGGRVRAGAAVLAVNAATRGVPAAAPPALGHLVAHRAHRAGPRRARTRSAGPAASASPTRARSCTTSARPATAGSRSAGAEAGSRPAPGSAGGSRSTPRSPRRPAATWSRCSRSSRAARSRTPGAGRSTSRRVTCRRSGRSTAPRSTTRSGITGNGVGPSHLAGRILAALAAGETSELAARPRAAAGAAGADRVGGRNAGAPCLFT